ADSGLIVVVQIAAGPDAGGVEVGGQVDEVADAHGVVEIEIADEGGADDDGAAADDGGEGNIAGVGGDGAGGQAGAGPGSAGAAIAGALNVGANGAEDGRVVDFEPAIVDVHGRGRIDGEIAKVNIFLAGCEVDAGIIIDGQGLKRLGNDQSDGGRVV